MNIEARKYARNDKAMPSSTEIIFVIIFKYILKIA
jgi:hypothetical protein